MPWKLPPANTKITGVELLPQGFLAKGWKDAMEEYKADKPEHKMAHLQIIMWSMMMVPLWEQRCKIQYDKDNKDKEAKGVETGRLQLRCCSEWAGRAQLHLVSSHFVEMMYC